MNSSPSVSPDDTASTDSTTPTRARTSTRHVGAFVAGFVALAAVGATVGWTVTKSPKHDVVTSPSPSVSAIVSSTPSASPSPSPSNTPPTTPTTSPGTSSTAFTIPAYGDRKTDFMTARTELITNGLGVHLIFEGPQPDTTAGAVLDSKPLPAKPVTRGATVTLYVAGDPPPLAMLAPEPNEACADFGKRVVAAGFDFSLKYDPRKFGLIASSVPAFGAASVWNAKVTLTCSADGPPPANPQPSTGTEISPSESPSDTQPTG